MRIHQIHLKNFKRFTDLTIKLDESKDTKLVVIIGSNGIGKSSIFDAFNLVSRCISYDSAVQPSENEMYGKGGVDDWVISFKMSDKLDIMLKCNYGLSHKNKNLFFGRSSLRIEPQISTVNADLNFYRQDRDRPSDFTKEDRRFSADVTEYIRIIKSLMIAPVFEGKSVDPKLIYEEHISPINNAIKRVFGLPPEMTYRLDSFDDSLINKLKLYIRKGEHKYLYDYLSHGEKQIINILLGLHMRSHLIQESILYLDELETHLNTAIQYELIKEIVENWLPAGCQLWTSTHSLGIIKYANESEHAEIIDLGTLDYDTKQTIFPSPKSKFNYNIALPDDYLIELSQKYKIVLCENKDATLYNLLDIDNVRFLPLKDARAITVIASVYPTITCLRDKDFLTPEEVNKIKATYSNIRILPYYSIESFRFHKSVLSEIGGPEFNEDEYLQLINDFRNDCADSLISKLHKSREKYFESSQYIIKPESIGNIITSLRSDNYDEYFQYLPFKTLNTQLLSDRYNISYQQVCKTIVFNEIMKAIIS